MTYSDSHRIASVVEELCSASRITPHIVSVRLLHGGTYPADDIVAHIAAGVTYHMVPTEHDQRHHPHYVATGVPIIMETRVCEHCGKTVLDGRNRKARGES